MRHRILLFATICALVVNFEVFGYRQPLEPVKSNYVVIGAFAIQKNATKFVEHVKNLNFKPVSEMNLNRNLYYVYVLSTSDKRAAFSEANKIRKETPFSDTWVYTGVLGIASAHQGQDVNPDTEKTIAKVAIADEKKPVAEKVVEPAEKVVEPVEKVATAQTAAPVKDTTSTIATTSSSTMTSKEVAVVAAPAAKDTAVPDAPAGSKNFVFEIYTSLTKKRLEGDVDLLDVDRARKVATFKGNENVVVRQMNRSGKVVLICEVFGYRIVKKNLDFNRPEETEAAVALGNKFVIPFELTRMKKGDIAIMYSVYFFQDAGIMQPQSRPEVMSLLEMMKENPNYKIRIHGHTNGNSAGKIISMGESKKFFSLDDTKEGFGSAKQLSEERANVIREFLVAGGVEASRMEIKAWGGKKPIHDKMSANARENVRVEIEILSE